MKKRLGQVSRTKLEDIYVSLREINGTPHVDVRVYRRPVRGGDAVAGIEGVTVPVDLFPALLRVLEESHGRLIQEGMLRAPDAESLRELSSDRRGQRVPLRIPVECCPWPVGDSQVLKGETADVSTGGAQLWLPECLSLLMRVEVFMQIEGAAFKELAEVVGVGVRPTNGRYRHSVRWLELSGQAKAALVHLISSV